MRTAVGVLLGVPAVAFMLGVVGGFGLCVGCGVIGYVTLSDGRFPRFAG